MVEHQIFTIILVSAVIGVLGGIVYLSITCCRLNKELAEALGTIKQAHERYAVLLNQKKSSEVRLGKIAENLAPFVEGWPWDPNNFCFLGNPVDGISFNENEIIFVEIKSGKSRLSEGQRKAKDLVKEGKVRFATFRVSDSGCELKIE